MAGLGLCLLLVCGLAGAFGVWSWLGLPGLRQGESPSTQAAAPPEATLYEDDFSDPSKDGLYRAVLNQRLASHSKFQGGIQL